jgi:hypothetical protein
MERDPADERGPGDQRDASGGPARQVHVDDRAAGSAKLLRQGRQWTDLVVADVDRSLGQHDPQSHRGALVRAPMQAIPDEQAESHTDRGEDDGVDCLDGIQCSSPAARRDACAQPIRQSPAPRGSP